MHTPTELRSVLKLMVASVNVPAPALDQSVEYSSPNLEPSSISGNSGSITDSGTSSQTRSVSSSITTSSSSSPPIMVPSTISVDEVLNKIIGITILDEPTDMLVIGAGHARTGTSSLKAALERLGLKSYHMKNAMMMDTQLWYEHSVERLKGNPGIYPRIMDSMAAHGYTATVDNPNILHYKELMERYPNAKVILGLRPNKKEGVDGGDSYATSVMNTIARFSPLFHRVPFRWMPTMQKHNVIRKWHFSEHGCTLDPVSLLPQYDDLVTSYDAWNKQVQEMVPPEKLLVFKATDGWEPLCEFLSPLDPTIERNCQEILQAEIREPFPFINDTAAMQSFQHFFDRIATVFETLPFVILLVVALCIMRWRAKSSTAKRREDDTSSLSTQQQQIVKQK